MIYDKKFGYKYFKQQPIDFIMFLYRHSVINSYTMFSSFFIMESSEPGIFRSWSTPHIGSVPLVSPTMLSNISYYVGLFEFAQGSSPRIVWDNDAKLIQNRDLFLLYIVNTPTDFPSETYIPKPTIIKSVYNDLFYIAIYMQINDVEARGFTRPLVLVVAHPIKKLITHLYETKMETLENYADKLQKSAAETFPHDIQKYTVSIRNTIEKHPESKELLQSKVNELESMMKLMKITPEKDIEPYDADPEYFLHIKNDLRPIKKLTHFNEIKSDLLKFISNLPNDVIQSRSLTQLRKETYTMIESVYLRDSPTLINIFKNKTIMDCLFTLYSGHTLFILANDTNEAQAIASRIAVLTPFGQPFPVVGSTERSDIAQIVICMSFDPEKYQNYSLMDLDNQAEFTGIKCPQDSILMKELPKNTDHSSTSLVSLFSIELKKIGMRFLCKMMELSRRASQPEERVAQQMRSIGFSSADEPILKNWTAIAQQIISSIP